ncbi:MAG: hypothetical protein CMB82_03685 [Flammeovirgaceae bacterium]|nr:hypothetical protein [Flammeovirgaceae bacterium]|tara:strand:- start:6944 stop:7174 length:231 start_codon:yes stop_codon:yes gene_type:complete
MKKIILFSTAFLCLFLLKASPIEASINVFDNVLSNKNTESIEVFKKRRSFVVDETPRRGRKGRRAERRLKKRKIEK